MMKDRINPLVASIKPSGIRKFFDLATTMEGVISLGVGEPDFDTPWHVREEAIYAIEKGKTFYTANAGLLPLREEITQYLQRRFQLTYHPKNEVIVTVGGSQAIDIALRTIVVPGDEVIVLTPAYVAYEPCITLAQGTPVCIPLREEDGFKLTKEALLSALTPKTKAIILNFPSNPTGGIMTKEDYAPLIPILKEQKLFVLTDEIYAELTYETKHESIAQFDEIKDQVIYISGFSKAYAMTGWRLGYVCAPAYLIEVMMKIHQFTIMCPPTLSQFAALSALQNGDEDVEEMRESFRQRRNYLVHGLRRIGIEVHLPQGAFYVFPSIKKFNRSSQAFCEALLDRQKLALVPGSAFGEAGEGFVRISYAYSLDEIKEALMRLEDFIKEIDHDSNCNL